MTLYKELGKGAFSTVYLAADTQLHKWVALKVIEKGLTRTFSQAPQMIEDEIMIYQRLPKHPAFCEYYRTLVSSGKVYIEMEPFIGEDLGTFFRETPATEEVAREIMRQIIDALIALEQEAIYDVDLKPGNILYNNRTKEIKIIDFNLVKLSKDPVRASLEQGLAEIGSIEVALQNTYRPESAVVWRLGAHYIAL